MSGFNGTFSIRSIQDAQAANLQMIAALNFTVAYGEAIREATAELERYAISITHVGKYIASKKSGKFRYSKAGGRGGGALRASHRMEITTTADVTTGHIYLDENATNPLTGRKTSIYGIYENARGGEHAFYDRTVAEDGDKALNGMVVRVEKAVDTA